MACSCSDHGCLVSNRAGPDSQRLELGHTLPIGEPRTGGSQCDHLLIALPYPYGADFQICAWEGRHSRILAAHPITAAERALKAEHGLEALESRLEDARADFPNPHRRSVV
jgi:hypothetical protein